MANLKKCANCGKKFSGTFSKCIKCDWEHFTCQLCYHPIAPKDHIYMRTADRIIQEGINQRKEEEIVTLLVERGDGIHLSCLKHHFTRFGAKCPDCERSISCQKFTIDSFLIPLRLSYSPVRLFCKRSDNNEIDNRYKFLKTSPCNCGCVNPLYTTSDCPVCCLPIISAIHETTSYHDDETTHNFCSPESRLDGRNNTKGFFSFLFAGSPYNP